MLQRCGECKDLKKLTTGPQSLCADERRDPPPPPPPPPLPSAPPLLPPSPPPPTEGGSQLALKVKYEAWEKITYTTKDGTVKVKKDFVSKEVP